MPDPMTPAQAALVFAAFQAWALDGDPSYRHDRELAALLLHADGSGGILPRGPALATTRELDPRWDWPAEALAAFPASVAVAPAGGDAVLRLVAVEFEVRDRLRATRTARDRIYCARSADPRAANDIGMFKINACVGIDGVRCAECTRRAELTETVRSVHAQLAAVRRDLRRAVARAGLYELVDAELAVGVPSPSRSADEPSRSADEAPRRRAPSRHKRRGGPPDGS